MLARERESMKSIVRYDMAQPIGEKKGEKSVALGPRLHDGSGVLRDDVRRSVDRKH